jgi:hypothetical protein
MEWNTKAVNNVLKSQRKNIFQLSSLLKSSEFQKAIVDSIYIAVLLLIIYRGRAQRIPGLI